jgi:glutamate synthase domain-containing protein 3
MVDLEPIVEKDDVITLKSLIQKHVDLTASAVGKKILDNWNATQPKFVKVFPKEYKRALAEKAAKESGQALAKTSVESWS